MRKRTIVTFSREQRQTSTYTKRLARRLALEQELSGVTKPVFAERIGISGSQFRAIRATTANPSLAMLCQIARAISAPLYELLEGEPLGARRNVGYDDATKAISKMLGERYGTSELTQRKFASSLRLSHAQIYKILSGDANPSLLTCVALAKQFNVTLWRLLGVEDAPPD